MTSDKGTPSQTGLLIIVSGPSGVGKTTIVRELEKQLGARFSVSMTTRAKTKRDVEGVDYYFVDEEAFQRAIEQGDLLEWAPWLGNRYGTPRPPVEEALAAGQLIILEIDVAGAEQVKAKMPDAFGIFIMPPNEQSLLDRLRRRDRDDEAAIERRFAAAKAEIDRAEGGEVYNHYIINDDLKAAIDASVKLVRVQLAQLNSADA
jgi:guanylate kinase